MSASKSDTVNIGVLLTFEAQMLDVAGIDLFGMLDKEYTQFLPGPLKKLGLDVHIYYIGQEGDVSPSSKQSESNLRGLTGQAQIKAATSLTDAAVQPGSLNILMIPGPPPGMQQSKATLEFVERHAKHETTILVVCTGCYVAAQAGVYDGRKVSAPRALVPQLRKEFPKAEWDDKKRWIVDVGNKPGSAKGELWSSGGVTNGLEMVAAFLKEKFPGPLSECICAMADVGDKGEVYDMTVGVDNSWWLGQIFRALIYGKRPVRFINPSVK